MLLLYCLICGNFRAELDILFVDCCRCELGTLLVRFFCDVPGKGGKFDVAGLSLLAPANSRGLIVNFSPSRRVTVCFAAPANSGGFCCGLIVNFAPYRRVTVGFAAGCGAGCATVGFAATRRCGATVGFAAAGGRGARGCKRSNPSENGTNRI